MTPSGETPIILISPETRATLAAEVDRGGMTGELSGGLLIGHPLDGNQRLVVSSVRLSADVGFGRQDFSLDQTRTSQQLEHAQAIDPRATYCGVWYLHRTPNQELIAEEWTQAQATLEDPDFAFADLVCLVLCFYNGKLTLYASSFNRYHSSRGQIPAPTELQLTTDWFTTPAAATCPSASPAPTEWHDSPDIATRLNQENQRLAKAYKVEQALAPNGQMFFRVSPKHKYERLSFYLAAGQGFPEKAPHVFLLVGGKPYRISTPGLGSWSATSWLVELADELVRWLVFSTGDYMRAAQEAFNRGKFHEAADLLTVVLAIEPRTPGAARLLARAQAPL